MNRRLTVLLALAALLVGCSPRPRAPALMQGEAVYVNAQEGFRFVPPPNWSLHARAEVPPGPLTQERLVVAYQRVSSGNMASFSVSMDDVPESENLTGLVKARRGDSEWKPVGPVEELEVGGRPAVRAAFQTDPREGGTLKEVVAVRKGPRVYFFTGFAPVKDAKARDQVRKSLATVSW